MSKLQTLARKRNFNKFRLLGFELDNTALTEEERMLYRTFKEGLLENWNARTKILGLKPSKDD